VGLCGSSTRQPGTGLGVGRIRIVDRDYVEWSNLQAPVPFRWSCDPADGCHRAIAGPPGGLARSIRSKLSEGSGLTPPRTPRELLAEADVILDGRTTSNADLINDYSISHGIPWVYGGAIGSYGIAMAVVPGRTACLKCIYPEPPSGAQPTCERRASFTPPWRSWRRFRRRRPSSSGGPYLIESPPVLRRWTFGRGSFVRSRCAAATPECKACGQRQFPHLDGAGRRPSACAANAVQIHERARPVDLARLKESLAPLGEVRVNEFALRFFLPPYEITVFPDGRAIIKGTTDSGIARSLYARYIGH